MWTPAEDRIYKARIKHAVKMVSGDDFALILHLKPVRYSGGDMIVLCGLAAIGFSLPLFLKDAGGLLHVICTYVIPVVVAGLAVAYEPWPRTRVVASSIFQWFTVQDFGNACFEEVLFGCFGNSAGTRQHVTLLRSDAYTLQPICACSGFQNVLPYFGLVFILLIFAHLLFCECLRRMPAACSDSMLWFDRRFLSSV